MKKAGLLFFFFSLAAQAFTHGQTMKALSYDVSNNVLALATNTNSITFKNSIAWATNSHRDTTRTNLGLGATWLTSGTAPLFWVSVPASPTNSGTAGQIAYTNNHLYICISNNTWRRVQLGTW